MRKLQAELLFLLFGVNEQTPSLLLDITLNTTNVFESTHIFCGNLFTQSETCSVDRQQQRREIVPVLFLQVEFEYGNLLSRCGALTSQATNVTMIEIITRNNDNYPLRWTSFVRKSTSTLQRHSGYESISPCGVTERRWILTMTDNDRQYQ